MKHLLKAATVILSSVWFFASPAFAGFIINTACPFQGGCSDVLVIYNANSVPVTSVWGNEAAEDFQLPNGGFAPNTFTLAVPQTWINPALPGYSALIEPPFTTFLSDIFGIVNVGATAPSFALGFQSPFLSPGVDPVLGRFVGQQQFSFVEPDEGILRAFDGSIYLNPQNPEIRGFTLTFISVDVPFGTTHIPEPATLTLLGLGLAGLGLRRRNKT